MTATYIETTVTLGDDRPEVWTHAGKYPTIDLGDVTIVVLTSEQAYALIGALEQAASFLEDAELAAKAVGVTPMPQRLRTLADWLEFWDLPDTNLFLHGGEYAGQVYVTATDRRELGRWSVALGTPATVLDFPEATPPWRAHTTSGTVRADGVALDIRVQWSQVLEDAPVRAA